MTTAAEVRLWGTTIGAVSLEDGQETASFEYSRGFSRSGIEVSPLHMPLSRKVYRFPALSRGAFHGLPGLLADSLPDRFGNALINAWLAQQGRPASSFNAVERLCYTGVRGMGALEYAPSLGPNPRPSTPLQVESLVRLASDILSQRQSIRHTLDEQAGALKHILQVGTSAGGARAKAVIAWNGQTGEIRSGQLDVPEGFEHWLIKFDGVSANRDRELADPQGFGAVEYAYYRMAVDAGITMSSCRLLEENGRRHFMTRRFDRTAGGDKVHMQSLAALAHLDFNAAGAHNYEQAFQVARTLGLGMGSIEQLFRRMVFNIVARNQDDHVKNIAFLMDRAGRWSLAPAFDLTYSYNPSGQWTSRHQMSMNAKCDDFSPADFKKTGKTVGLKRGRAKSILREVCSSVRRWPAYAAEARVDTAFVKTIADNHRLSLGA